MISSPSYGTILFKKHFRDLQFAQRGNASLSFWGDVRGTRLEFHKQKVMV